MPQNRVQFQRGMSLPEFCDKGVSNCLEINLRVVQSVNLTPFLVPLFSRLSLSIHHWSFMLCDETTSPEILALLPRKRAITSPF